MRYPKLFNVAVSGAIALSLGLAGCSSSSTTTTEVTTEETTTADDGTTSTTTTTETTTDGKTETTTTTTDSKTSASSDTIDVDSWTDAWMGTSDKDEYFYYAESPDGSFGAMVILNDNDEYWRYVGPTSSTKEGYVVITDAESGASVTFEVTAADEEGNVEIDLGKDGKAVLGKCDIDKVWEAIGLATEYLEKVN